jgi:glutathione S-transferase
MTGKRILLHTFFLLMLPVLVAWYGISTAGALALVILALLWRWAITLSGFIAPARIPELELETITLSHYAEKVRWCMDRLGIEYTERQMVGVLGAFFTGRSVPQLKFRTGGVQSKIGNSPEILRYLWGAYCSEPKHRAGFLRPTKDRLELEEKVDRYGRDLQVWVYYHVLGDRELTQYAWGCTHSGIPHWQRYAVIALFPVLRILMRWAFQISGSHYKKVVDNIEKLLADTEQQIIDDQVSLLGDETPNFADIAFAAMTALWLRPPEFGNGKTSDIRIERERMPEAMRADVNRWINDYPGVVKFVGHLYQQERARNYGNG